MTCQHKYTTNTTKATLSISGKNTKVCTICGDRQSTTIAYPKTIQLSTAKYTYDGKVKTPGLTVKDSAGQTISSTYYTVTKSSGRKNVGKYTYKISFKTLYTGTKTLSFVINPKATSISTLKPGSCKMTVKWAKQTTQTTGYQIQYSTSSSFASPKTVNVTSNKTVSKAISKLKSGKKYYIRIRTYKTVDSTKYYSAWSAKKYVNVK